MLRFQILIFLCILFNIPLQAEGGGGNNDTKPLSNEGMGLLNDSLKATPVLGKGFVGEKIKRATLPEILALKDSMLSMGASFSTIQEINLAIRLRKMTETEVVILIDSLLDLEEIPFKLVDQINSFVNYFEYAVHKREEELKVLDQMPMYPAHNLYGQWDTKTPNPYDRKKITKQDSLVTLCINNGTDAQCFALPKSGVVTSHFGWRMGRNHNGMDIDLEVMDTVVSAFSGMVRMAGTYGGYGRVVIIRHFNGLETTYAHLHRIKVKSGQLVDAGELIGYGGSSGHSTGSHLHFECRYKGYPIDPESILSFEEGELKSDTIMLIKNDLGFVCMPKGSEFHEVKPGDYLYKIAKHYGTTTTKLCQLNGIRRDKTLRVGDKIRVI